VQTKSCVSPLPLAPAVTGYAVGDDVILQWVAGQGGNVTHKVERSADPYSGTFTYLGNGVDQYEDEDILATTHPVYYLVTGVNDCGGFDPDTIATGVFRFDLIAGN
jgi:hypothetical protein